MSNFVKEFFKSETIYGKPEESLPNILERIEEEHLRILSTVHHIDVKKTRTEKINLLIENILNNFSTTLLSCDQEELKSFHEFYNGAVDYSNKYVYLHLKKFVQLGYIYLFTENDGRLFHFQIPVELCVQFEQLLQTS